VRVVGMNKYNRSRKELEEMQEKLKNSNLTIKELIDMKRKLNCPPSNLEEGIEAEDIEPLWHVIFITAGMTEDEILQSAHNYSSAACRLRKEGKKEESEYFFKRAGWMYKELCKEKGVSESKKTKYKIMSDACFSGKVSLRYSSGREEISFKHTLE
jgi:hypothetical protein